MSSEIDIVKIILHSGLIAKIVLLCLILASILSWAIILKKRKFYKLVKADNQKFLDFFYSSNKLGEISARVEMFPKSSFGTIYRRGYAELLKIVEKRATMASADDFNDYFSKSGINALERSLKHGVNESNEDMESWNSVLASVGSISPFVGLFGTVWGIIGSFQGLAAGGGSIEMIAPGIAEALVATAVGLFAAIPAVWFFNDFNNETSKINAKMESFCLELLNRMERSVLAMKPKVGQ